MLAISQRWDSGTAGSRSPANRPTRVRDWAGGAYFPDKIETHKYEFVSVLCVSLAKGVDTVCRELPLRCRWSYYVWCGRGGGLVSEGVNRYVTAPEALCTQEGRRCLSIFFHPHPCYHHSLPLSFWASQRGLDVERDIWLGLRNMRNCIWADSKPGSVASHLKNEKSHGNDGEDDIRGSDV